MDTSILSAKDRQQLEELLDQFDRALKACRNGKLPDMEAFLSEYQGKERTYLRREMEALSEDLIRGEYVKIRRIGGGGMGEVFLARHIALGREFALKEIKLECLQGERREFESRFKREIEACGRLENHPNIVSVTNTGTSDSGIPYLVMEYIDGQDLKQLVEGNGPLGIGHACRIIHDAAVGLAHAHEKGLVHRDIKPSNLMVSKHGVVTVLDLGLARVIGSNRQATFVSVPGLVGSFDYMSPEQCREQADVDSRADVYSLGCTLYFLLAGEPPFSEAGSIFQKLDAHQKEPAPRIDLLADYPQLERIVGRMLAKRPDDRYQQLREVAVDLETFAHGVTLLSLLKAGATASPPGDSGAHATMPYPGSRTYVAQSATIADGRPGGGRRKFLRTAAALATTATAGVAITYFGWPRATLQGNFIATLPGLNGRWWFEEIPWLLPEVRLLLMQRIDAPAAKRLLSLAYRADTPEFYQSLKSLAQETIRASSDAVQSRFAGLPDLDPETLEDKAFEALLSSKRDGILATPRERRSAVDQHLLAIIYHHFADFAGAQAAYEAAFGSYERDSPLRAMCLSDWGHMSLKQREPTVAMAKFQLCRNERAAGRSKSQLFKLHALCMEADANRRIPNWDVALLRLREARLIAEGLVADHPLRSVYEERSGWYHLGAWHLSAAEDNFSNARSSRQANQRGGNFRALHFEYWDRQGKAMVDFYRGAVGSARTEFEAMLREIATNGKLKRKQIDELLSREPNLYERLSDTHLVWRLFDTEDRSQNAATQLDSAIVSAGREHFDVDGRKTVLVRLKYKTALAWAMAGDSARAQNRLQSALALEKKFIEKKFKQDAHTSTTSQTMSGKRTTHSHSVTVQLTQGYFAFLDDPATIRERLLPLFAKNPSIVGRDDLLLLLLVGHRLLESDDVDGLTKIRLASSLETLTQVSPRAEAVDAKKGDQRPKNPGLFDRFRSAIDDWRVRENNR